MNFQLWLNGKVIKSLKTLSRIEDHATKIADKCSMEIVEDSSEDKEWKSEDDWMFITHLQSNW